MPKPIILIDDDTKDDEILFPSNMGRGLVPRDFNTDPPEMFSPPSEMPLIPRSEWDARIDEQERLQSSLEHIRNTSGPNGQAIPYLNQGPVGYCWGHSTVHTVMLSRAVNNQPYVPLSAFAVCATIKNGADEGGWCGLSAKFLREKGVPSQKYWPQGSRDLNKYTTAEMWANAAEHKITEDWVDLTRQLWQQNLTFDMVASCLLTNIPVALDFNWWGHSVCGLRLVRVEAGSYGIKILNSWLNWGDNGTGILRGERAIPNGAVATRLIKASVN